LLYIYSHRDGPEGVDGSEDGSSFESVNNSIANTRDSSIDGNSGDEESDDDENRVNPVAGTQDNPTQDELVT
jgi:hypothetical protein